VKNENNKSFEKYCSLFSCGCNNRTVKVSYGIIEKIVEEKKKMELVNYE